MERTGFINTPQPRVGAALRGESPGLLSAQTRRHTPNDCPVCDCLLTPFPKANARLVRTLIYISLGGVSLGVKEQSCSILKPDFSEQHSAIIPQQPAQRTYLPSQIEPRPPEP